MTLSEFLTARLDEDEAAAHKEQWCRDGIPGEPLPNFSLEGPGDPARVLAEVDAKRRIMALYAEHADYDDIEESYEHATGRIIGLGEALRLLVLPYADHPDYQQEWRP